MTPAEFAGLENFLLGGKLWFGRESRHVDLGSWVQCLHEGRIDFTKSRVHLARNVGFKVHVFFVYNRFWMLSLTNRRKERGRLSDGSLNFLSYFLFATLCLHLLQLLLLCFHHLLDLLVERRLHLFDKRTVLLLSLLLGFCLHLDE